MLKRTKTISVALFLVLLVSGIGFYVLLPTPPRDVDKICKRGEIRIAVRMNQIDYMMRGDTLAGFQYELAKQFADSCLHVKPQFIRVSDLSEAIIALKMGKVDLIAQNIPETTEMLDGMIIASPIVISKAVLVQRKGTADDTVFISNQLSLGKKQLCVVKGSPYSQRIKHLSEEISDTIYVSEMDLHDSEELILLIAKGSIRYGVCDEKVAYYFAKRFPGIDVGLDIGFSQMQGWGINQKSPVLANTINLWMQKFVKTAKFNQLYAKYYN
jgi:membrane-bound lytic murein transglycosylase MltF